MQLPVCHSDTAGVQALKQHWESKTPKKTKTKEETGAHTAPSTGSSAVVLSLPFRIRPPCLVSYLFSVILQLCQCLDPTYWSL